MGNNTQLELQETSVLLVGNNQEDYLRFQRYVNALTKQRLKLDWVSDYNQALKILLENRYNLYLLENLIDQKDGLVLLQSARHQGFQGPVIFLSNQADLDLDLKAMQNGAVDFLVKDKIDQPIFEKSIRYAVQNWEIRQALENSVREKEILFREIHHRVKNNLQIVTSLLRLQSHQVEHEDARQALRESCHCIRAMSLIHDQLYRSQKIEAVNFSDYVHCLIDELARVYAIDLKQVTLDLKIEHAHLPLDLAVPCGLIVHELVTNAFKHAFPEARKGQLEVSFKRIDLDFLELRVSDDGIGMPAHSLEQEKNTLGRDLIQALASQLQTKAQLEQQNGSRWTFRFKEKLRE